MHIATKCPNLSGPHVSNNALAAHESALKEGMSALQLCQTLQTQFR